MTPSEKTGSTSYQPEGERDDAVDPTKSAPGTSQFKVKQAWALTSFTTLALGAVNFATAPLAARSLGNEGRGRLATIQLTPQLLAEMAALGLGFAVVHFGSKKTSSIRQLIRWSIKPILAASLVAFAIGQLVASWLADGNAADERIIRFYLIICPLIAFLSVLLESLRAIGNFGLWNFLLFFRGLAWPIALFFGAILVVEPSLEVLFGVHVGLLVVMLVVTGITVRKALPNTSSDPAVCTSGEFLRFGYSSALSGVPRIANSRIDQIILTSLVTTSQLGVYAVAVGWSFLPVPILRGLTGVVMPHISGATENQRADRVSSLATLGLAFTGLLSLGGVMVTFLLFAPIYGEDFASGRNAAMVLIPAALILEFNAILGNALRSMGRVHLLTVIEASLLIVAVGLLWPATAFDPVLGPALLSVIVYLGAGLVMARSVARQANMPIGDLIQPARIGQDMRQATARLKAFKRSR